MESVYVLDIKLEPRSALNGALFEYKGLTLRELPDVKLLSVATNSNQKSAASDALKQHCGVNWPEVGKSTVNGKTRCLGLQIDQVFVMHMDGNSNHVQLASDLASEFPLTDQSDSWVAVEVSGNRTLDVLERICPIDLHETAFRDGAVARTTMEHLSVIIVSQGTTFLLLSPRSSADSFLHALTQSAEFVL